MGHSKGVYLFLTMVGVRIDKDLYNSVAFSWITPKWGLQKVLS